MNILINKMKKCNKCQKNENWMPIIIIIIIIFKLQIQNNSQKRTKVVYKIAI